MRVVKTVKDILYTQCGVAHHEKYYVYDSSIIIT